MTYKDDNMRLLMTVEELVRASFSGDIFDEILKIILLMRIAAIEKIELEKLSINEINQILINIRQEFEEVIDGESFALDLNHLRSIFSSVNYSQFTFNIDFVDNYFESLIAKLDKADKGQFFTPRHVVEFCVRIAGIKLSDKIVDPSCGAGGFLIHSVERLRPGILKNEEAQLTGFDIDSRVIRLARLNFMIKGFKNYKLMTQNTLKRNYNDENNGKYDIVFANPPFAGEIRDSELLRTYSITSKATEDRDVLFIERSYELLKEDGKMIIVLPYSVFGSKHAKYVRKWIFEKFEVIAIISLARSTFLPYTHQKANILVCRKAKHKGDKIFMSISKSGGKSSSGEWVYQKEIEKSKLSDTWSSVDHDLEDIEYEFKDYLIKEDIRW